MNFFEGFFFDIQKKNNTSINIYKTKKAPFIAKPFWSTY